MGNSAEQARRHETQLDWRGATELWLQARAQGLAGAREGLERCRRAEAVIEELCGLAEEDIDQRELRAATEPLEAAMEVGGETHPRIRPLKKQWFQLRRDLMRGGKRAGCVAAVICIVVAIAVAYLLDSASLPEPVPEVGGGAAALFTFLILYALIPALREKTRYHLIRLRTPGKKRLRAPGKKRLKAMRGRSRKTVKAPRPSRSRAVLEWRRNAARENRDWWSNP